MMDQETLKKALLELSFKLIALLAASGLNGLSMVTPKLSLNDQDLGPWSIEVRQLPGIEVKLESGEVPEGVTVH